MWTCRPGAGGTQGPEGVHLLAGGRIWHDPRKNEPWASDAQIRKSSGCPC